MKLIVLHASCDNNAIYINAESIVAFYESATQHTGAPCTEVYTKDCGESYMVRESCNEILDLLSKEVLLRVSESGCDNEYSG